jgi:REP element-mobilizing transposase RayT
LYRPPKSLGSFIAGYKSVVTKKINQHCHIPGQPVWQRNYYEHIIRNEHALNAIREYITHNPLSWHLDRYNFAAVGNDPRAKYLWGLLKAS